MRRFLAVCGTIAVCLARSDVAQSQSRDTTSARTRPIATQQAAAAAPACCSIVRIDSRRSIITARESATGFTFRFAVKSRRLFATLKIGQPVWADFANKTVKLRATDATPCCGIVETQETP